MKVYIIYLDELDREERDIDFNSVDDDTFITLSKLQDEVYTIEDFCNYFNKGWIDQRECILRILEE